MGEIEPDGQYLPDDAEHATQVDAPKVLENLPTEQAIHSAERSTSNATFRPFFSHLALYTDLNEPAAKALLSTASSEY